jgi:ketosteroid isomerase-like protein
MRTRVDQGPLTVQVIAGSRCVLFGMSVTDALGTQPTFLGFAIHRKDLGSVEERWLPNFLCFAVNERKPSGSALAATLPTPVAFANEALVFPSSVPATSPSDDRHLDAAIAGHAPIYGSDENPFQAFLWGDYTCAPDQEYEYRIEARVGAPGKLTSAASVTARVKTSATSGVHHVYFNRGVLASQSYINKFGNVSPKSPALPPAQSAQIHAWLSRGLLEALIAFLGRARDETFSVRAAIYQFQYGPVLDAFRAAADRGADVKIIFDDVPNSAPPGSLSNKEANEKAIRDHGLDGHQIPRTHTKIAHNKFVVLLQNNTPIAVWTGSTNITEGALFGQSNVGHQLDDRTLAGKFFRYWEYLAGNPSAHDTKEWNLTNSGYDSSHGRGVQYVFSPQPTLEVLQRYAHVAAEAGEAVMMTCPFMLSEPFVKVLSEQRDYLRYILFDKHDGTLDVVNRVKNNVVTYGAKVPPGGYAQWLYEQRNDLDEHVRYIHSKVLIVDPFSNPVVIVGSANFSKASTNANDENMLVITGDPDLADIYVTEFMRLFSHYCFRAKVNPRGTPASGADKTESGASLGERPNGPAFLASLAVPTRQDTRVYLKTTNSAWASDFYKPGTAKFKERLLFSGSNAAKVRLSPDVSQRAEGRDAPMSTSANSPEAQAIDRMYAEALRSFQIGDLDGVLSHWDEGGAYLWPAVPPAIGKNAIRSAYQGFFAEWTAAEIYRPEKVEVSGDLAYRRFSTDLVLTPKAGGPPKKLKLNGVHVYGRHADGSWKFKVVIAIDAP